MFIKWNDKSVRLLGRWGSVTEENITTTTTGAIIEFAFSGDMAIMHFDTITNEQPYPHVWITVDGGARIEAPIDSYLRIVVNGNGNHIVKVIYKGGVERHHRWYEPLTGKISFKGYEADCAGLLPDDNRKTIEFVGDSITEGVLIDDDFSNKNVSDGQLLRVYQDDVCATYAWITAEKLNLRPIFMGYGAVGMTKGGMGAVPKAAEAYPFAYNNCKANIWADYILINHGANDGGAAVGKYIEEYENTLNVVRKLNPTSKIICLSAFCGVHAVELGKFIEEYNENMNESILFIDSSGWIPQEPLHPNRNGHIKVAEKLVSILRELLYDCW